MIPQCLIDEQNRVNTLEDRIKSGESVQKIYTNEIKYAKYSLSHNDKDDDKFYTNYLNVLAQEDKLKDVTENLNKQKEELKIIRNNLNISLEPYKSLIDDELKIVQLKFELDNQLSILEKKKRDLF